MEKIIEIGYFDIDIISKKQYVTYICVLYSRKDIIRINNYVKKLAKIADCPGRILRVSSRIGKINSVDKYIREKEQETQGGVLVEIKMLNSGANLPYGNEINTNTWFPIKLFFGKDNK